MARQFNAITGRELQTIVLKEVQQQLDMDPRFDQPEAFPSAVVLFTLRVQAYPSDQPEFTMQITQKIGGPQDGPKLKRSILNLIARDLAGDLRFGNHLTYPKVTWDHRLSLELPGGIIGRDVELVPAPGLQTMRHSQPEIDNRAPVAQPITVDPELARREKLVAEIERLRAELVKDVAVAVETGQPLSSAEVKHRHVDNETATGLPIEAGFKAGPGIEAAGSFLSGDGSAAGGGAFGAMAAQRIEFGVSHPDLDDGGAGAADAIRRDHGLVIPQTTTDKDGRMVDLPAGTF